MHYLFNDQCSHHIETSQLICIANQLTGFYIIKTLVVKGLILRVPCTSAKFQFRYTVIAEVFQNHIKHVRWSSWQK